jgi:hypothetical protein
MAASKLSLYNTALLILGERRLESLYENREPRRVLDEFYAAGAIDYCLELAKPQFALKTAALTSPAASSAHALDYVYTFPTDMVTTLDKKLGGSFFSDAALEVPVNRYLIESRTVATEVATTLYARYICNSRAMSDWTPSFERVVSAYLAFMCAPRINPTKQGIAESRFKDALETAVLTDGVRASDLSPFAKTVGTLTDAFRLLYNRALSIVGLPPLLSALDDSAARTELDRAITQKAVDTILDVVGWNFACVTTKLTYDNTYTATWGFTYRHVVPAAMSRIDQIAADEFFRVPIDYRHEGGYFYSEHQYLYVSYVSTTWLTTPSTWPIYFWNFVAAELAKRVAHLPGANGENAEILYEQYKSEAFSTDAQRNPPQRISGGSWTGSRGRGVDRSRFHGR